MTTISFHYDLNSPYAHVALAAMSDLPSTVVIRPSAVLLGAIFSHHGIVGPPEVPAKREHVFRHVVHLGNRLGRPVKVPLRHPFHPVASQRLMAGAHGGNGATLDEVRAAFDFVFGEGRAPDNDDEINALATHAGLDPALASAEISKSALRGNTDAAIAAGVFGVPSFVPQLETGETGPVFWGVDSIQMLNDWLENPAIFDQDEYRRLENVEYGIKRK